jgi:hypothetical protein
MWKRATYWRDMAFGSNTKQTFLDVGRLFRLLRLPCSKI